MARASRSSAKSKTAARGHSPAVDAVFKTYPQPTKARLLALRRLILDTARTTDGAGRIEETLKWGQPSYLTPETKSGSTVRIDHVDGKQYAIYFHCQTDLPRALSRQMELRWQPVHHLEC